MRAQFHKEGAKRQDPGLLAPAVCLHGYKGEAASVQSSAILTMTTMTRRGKIPYSFTT